MDLEGNPLKKGGWTTIVNNYCTGDFHTGNLSPEVTSADKSETVTVYHNGYKNTKTVLSWIQKQPEFSPKQEMVVGGGSKYLDIFYHTEPC